MCQRTSLKPRIRGWKQWSSRNRVLFYALFSMFVNLRYMCNKIVKWGKLDLEPAVAFTNLTLALYIPYGRMVRFVKSVGFGIKGNPLDTKFTQLLVASIPPIEVFQGQSMLYFDSLCGDGQLLDCLNM